MKKKRRALIPFMIGASLLLSGCGASGSSSTSSSSSSSSSAPSSESSTLPSSSSSTSTSVPPTTIDDVTYINKSITTGGVLSDITPGIECALAVGNEYDFNFSFSNGVSTADAVVVSSDTNVMTVSRVGTTGSTYRLTINAQNDVVLTIKDSTGYLHYRNVVHCRERISSDKMEEHLVSIDKWQSLIWGDNSDFSLVFLGDSNAVISGKDEGTAIGSIEFTIAFNYENDEEIVYTIGNWTNKVTTLNPNAIHVSVTGDIIHLTQGSGSSFLTDAIFRAAK